MARPMILIKKEKLIELYNKHVEGVPILTLIRKNDLAITAPTLTKLFLYVKAWNDVTTKAKDIIEKSLFPDWLHLANEVIVIQPSEYRYEGSMPLGKWVHNNWSEDKTNI